MTLAEVLYKTFTCLFSNNSGKKLYYKLKKQINILILKRQQFFITIFSSEHITVVKKIP